MYGGKANKSTVFLKISFLKILLGKFHRACGGCDKKHNGKEDISVREVYNEAVYSMIPFCTMFTNINCEYWDLPADVFQPGQT